MPLAWGPIPQMFTVIAIIYCSARAGCEVGSQPPRSSAKVGGGRRTTPAPPPWDLQTPQQPWAPGPKGSLSGLDTPC